MKWCFSGHYPPKGQLLFIFVVIIVENIHPMVIHYHLGLWRGTIIHFSFIRIWFFRKWPYVEWKKEQLIFVHKIFQIIKYFIGDLCFDLPVYLLLGIDRKLTYIVWFCYGIFKINCWFLKWFLMERMVANNTSVLIRFRMNILSLIWCFAWCLA